VCVEYEKPADARKVFSMSLHIDQHEDTYILV
jgi:hypothetical protein